MWAPMWPCWLMALFQRFWRRLTVISRAEWLITDGPSSVGEVAMIGAGIIEHRELNYYTSEKRHFLVHLRLDPTCAANNGEGAFVVPHTRWTSG